MYSPVYETQDYIGVSTDTKPTTNVSIGSCFYETDTKNIYIYGPTGWSMM